MSSIQSKLEVMETKQVKKWTRKQVEKSSWKKNIYISMYSCQIKTFFQEESHQSNMATHERYKVMRTWIIRTAAKTEFYYKKLLVLEYCVEKFFFRIEALEIPITLIREVTGARWEDNTSEYQSVLVATIAILIRLDSEQLDDSIYKLFCWC